MSFPSEEFFYKRVRKQIKTKKLLPDSRVNNKEKKQGGKRKSKQKNEQSSINREQMIVRSLVPVPFNNKRKEKIEKVQTDRWTRDSVCCFAAWVKENNCRILVQDELEAKKPKFPRLPVRCLRRRVDVRPIHRIQSNWNLPSNCCVERLAWLPTLPDRSQRWWLLWLWV